MQNDPFAVPDAGPVEDLEISMKKAMNLVLEDEEILELMRIMLDEDSKLIGICFLLCNCDNQ